MPVEVFGHFLNNIFTIYSPQIKADSAYRIKAYPAFINFRLCYLKLLWVHFGGVQKSFVTHPTASESYLSQTAVNSFFVC